VTTTIRKLALDAYLAHNDGTDHRYELVVREELVKIPLETKKKKHLIALYLFLKIGV
jgi:hypothetical protein